MTLGIQFGGLASGLDTGAIIDAILGVERRPIRVLEARKEQDQQRLTLLGTFDGLLKTLRDKVGELQKASEFFAHTLTVGEEGVAAFTLGGSAEAGAHTLEVLSLASADRYAFTGVADPEAALGAGTVSFGYGTNTYSIDVVAGSDSLNDIATAINTAAGDDVTATVVNAGTETSPSYQLVIAGDDTGADHVITGLASTVAGLTGATRVSTATNARVVVDGLAVERSSNLFSDVLPGVSFSVSRTNAGAPLSFTVALDPAGIKTNVQEFVDAYNAVVEFIGDQNTYSEEGGPGGLLFGDGALESVRGTMRRALFGVDISTVVGDTEGYSTLGLIGIELENDGKLSIDSEKLEEKLSGNLDLFSDFFRKEGVAADWSDYGVFGRLEGMLDDLLDDSTAPNGRSVDGLLDSRESSLQRLISDHDDEIERLELRLERLEETLIQKFTNLEKLMSGLQSQQAFLSANFASLNAGR